MGTGKDWRESHIYFPYFADEKQALWEIGRLDIIPAVSGRLRTQVSQSVLRLLLWPFSQYCGSSIFPKEGFLETESKLDLIKNLYISLLEKNKSLA